MDIIEHTIQDNQRIFDVTCKRLATGLIQDMATSLQEQFNAYLDRVMNILNYILKETSIPTDVKNIGIIALGDICLMSEAAF